MPIPQKKIPLSEAIIKIRTYCNYRDRCHKEVRDKLYSMGLWKKEVDQVILQMMDEDLLNEERFARSFARGYFRTKRWGKQKIRYELKARMIHSKLIEKALAEIEDDEYQSAIKHLIDRKNATLKGMHKSTRKLKVSNYLLQKGYAWSEFSPLLEK